jgi:hypothetical protein
MEAKMQLWRKFYLYVGVGIIAANTLVAEDPAHPTESESQTRGRTVTVAAVPSRARIHLGSYRIGETIKQSILIVVVWQWFLTDVILIRAKSFVCRCTWRRRTRLLTFGDPFVSFFRNLLRHLCWMLMFE